MPAFKTVGLIAKPKGLLTNEVTRILDIVSGAGFNVVLDCNASRALHDQQQYPVMTQEEIADAVDIAITIGGDGTMVGAARTLGKKSIPIIGVNAGRLGFITDIVIDEIESTLPAMLRGEYVTDTRPILYGEIFHQGKLAFSSCAVNEIGICHGRALGMVEYALAVDNQPMAIQRADGVIVSTSTGSTAYAMSAGGPVLHPMVRSMLLVPIAPHTLSNRPIVIHSQSQIEIEIKETRSAVASFDAQVLYDVEVGDVIRVHVLKDASFVMLHPKGFNYFDLLRRKLHWSYLPRGEQPVHVPEG